YVHRKGDPANQWILMHERPLPVAGEFTKVKIDWSGGNQNISSHYSAVGDHAEISLTGADLWTPDATYDWKLHPGYQSLIHFWDAQTTFASVGISNAADVDGVICSYVAWVKEPEMANKLVGTVAADLRPGSLPEQYSSYASGGMTGYKDPNNPNSQVNQLLVSRAACLTAMPTVFVSHNVYPALYDEIVDTDYIQGLLGMK
ncbi:MAG: hypothetical protein J6X61_00395, partial [Clostridia bacterium]|nr:hypothetical protein [Clostridia bacterium]